MSAVGFREQAARKLYIAEKGLVRAQQTLRSARGRKRAVSVSGEASEQGRNHQTSRMERSIEGENENGRKENEKGGRPYST